MRKWNVLRSVLNEVIVAPRKEEEVFVQRFRRPTRLVIAARILFVCCSFGGGVNFGCDVRRL